MGEDQALARNSLPDLVAVDLLDRVDGDNADNGGAVFSGFREDLLEDRILDERPYSVVNGDQLSVRAERRKGVLDRLLAAVPACDEPLDENSVCPPSCYRNRSSSNMKPSFMASRVAGSGPRPSAKARSSLRRP